MEGLLGPSDRSPQENNFPLGATMPLFGSSLEQQNEVLSFSNQTNPNYFNEPLRSTITSISPSVSIPNPKRANPIDFLGLHDMSNTTQQQVRTPNPQHDRFGSSFSHLSTESRTELTALGMNISRAKSSDAPTPDASDPFSVHSPLVWQQSRNSLGLNSFHHDSTFDHLAERGISPKPSVLSLSSGMPETGLKQVISEPGRLDSKAWPFVDKPPGLLSRATSSLGISHAQTSTLLSGLTRPLSTPAYLNKNNDSLSALGFSLNGPSHDPSSLLFDFGGPRGSDDTHLDNLGSELPSSLNFAGLGIESNSNNNEESRWPKPVRYGRALDTSESILGSILRPPSSADGPTRSSGLSPLSNVERLSISPKPLGEKNIMESKILALSREHTPPPAASRISPKLSITAVDDRAIENVIATNCHHILFDAAEHSLKAVELANTLRARVGTEVLAIVRERWGGLLSLLERHPDKFLVERIPKNDRVSLYTSKHALESQKNGGAATEGNRTDVTASDGKEGDEDHENIDSQQASRCLHVGNVPSNYTEVQLMKEFEKFGQLDGLKLITQKNGNRRFAFVTFKTVSQAITARHCLSKVHPWKSAISFAHRDFTNNKPNQNQNQSHTNNHHHNSTGNSNSNSHHHGSTNHSHSHSSMNVSSHYSHHNQGHLTGGNPSFHQKGSPKKPVGTSDHQYPSHLSQTGTGHRVQSYHPSHVPSNTLSNSQHHFSDTFSGKSMPLQSQANHLLTGTDASRSMQLRTHPSEEGNSSSGGARQGSTANNSTLIGTHPAIENYSDKNALQIIRTRLCDDTYVPTQPWPADATADAPFCQAVIDQVNYFGGSATISKLRGFLKHRVGTVDNIKSVPLKALLLAYTDYFKIEGNLVTLVTASVPLPLPSPPN